MRALACLLTLMLLAVPACKRRQRSRVQMTDEGAPVLSTLVYAADPRSGAQLVRGWHSIEQNSWRWTMAKFSALLRPPRAAAQNGAILELKLAVPDAVINKVGAITLSASIGGAVLKPETYSKAGEYVYRRDVDAAVLAAEAVAIDFSLDKSIAPSESDHRELGVVVASVGFVAK